MSDGRPSTSTTLSGSSLDDYIANASVMELNGSSSSKTSTLVTYLDRKS